MFLCKVQPVQGSEMPNENKEERLAFHGCLSPPYDFVPGVLIIKITKKHSYIFKKGNIKIDNGVKGSYFLSSTVCAGHSVGSSISAAKLLAKKVITSIL